MHQFGLLRAGKALRVALTCAALMGLSACATNPSSKVSPAASQAATQPAADSAQPVAPQAEVKAAPATNTTVAELQDLIRDHKVDELRTIYNASYGASMLFKPDDLTYYVVLFQQRNFWQVIKTKSPQQANLAYKIFAARTAELAQADFDRIRLQAENAKAQELLNASQARLDTLKADQALREQEDQQVVARQNQINAETDRLNQQQQIARSQLTDLQHQIDALQAEQNRLLGVSRPAPRRPSRTYRSYRKTSYHHSNRSRARVTHKPAAAAAPAAAPQAAPQAAAQPGAASPAAQQTDTQAAPQTAAQPQTTPQAAPQAPASQAPATQAQPASQAQ